MTIIEYNVAMKQNEKIQPLMDLAGFSSLSNVQEKVIPAILNNQSLVVNSPTGTGKTHAYLFGIFAKLTKKPVTQAIIVAPTRELATQITRFANELAEGYEGISVKTYVGGEHRASNPTQAQIVIGTIGRINDLYLESRVLELQTASMLVLDEADMMVDAGFIEECDKLLSNLAKDIQTLVFSATIPVGLQPFLKKYLINSKNIQVLEDDIFNPKIDFQLIDIKHRTYPEMIHLLLKGISPSQCLIFANSKEEVIEIAAELRKSEKDVIELHKDLSSSQRKHSLQRIVDHQVTFIVASDIAARGLDFEHVTHVISCGFPKELSYFKHRAGRTGRAGKDGICFTLYTQKDHQTILTLTSQGTSFRHMAYQKDEWKELMPYNHKHRYISAQDKQIISKIKGKRTKVKPNYKKKQEQEIEEYHRKKRRTMIKGKINEQKKARAKAKAKAKEE
jgi:ATP-dependent RNA helicase CshB